MWTAAPVISMLRTLGEAYKVQQPLLGTSLSPGLCAVPRLARRPRAVAR